VPDQTGIRRRRARAAEDNKAAVLRFYEEAKQFFGLLNQAFPDLRVEVNDVIAEGDPLHTRRPRSTASSACPKG
jgi:hypothetical protein